MLLRFLVKLSLTLAIIAAPQFYGRTADSMFCASLARAADVDRLGDKGKDGPVGQKGQDGKNSDALTVFADGTPMTLDLSGANGLQGNSGSAGTKAVCDGSIENKTNNLQASNGGNGGDGGDGGNGGNGGALTIYTTDKSNLSQVFVAALGGHGGTAGEGGQGGEGCKCPTYSWSEQTCKGKPGSANYSCTTKELKCNDGYSGSSGRSGRAGRQGRLGSLTLINLDKSLSPDSPKTTMSFAALKDRGFTLSRNEWEINQGATDLLAPGSVIADEYKELVARHEHTILLAWDSQQPIAEFAKEKVILALDENDQPQVTFPKDLWLETNELKRDKISEFVIFNAIKEQDVTKLKNQGLSGIGPDLQLTIEDKAKKNSILDTSFTLNFQAKVSTGSKSQYQSQFQGAVPASAVEQNGDFFTINLGQLSIPPEFLGEGNKVAVELIANRSFAQKHEKQQKIAFKKTLKVKK